jgi:hypothetical protein
LNLNFKGIAIGNGIVSARHQYPEHPRFLFENDLVSREEFLMLKGCMTGCQAMIDAYEDNMG